MFGREEKESIVDLQERLQRIQLEHHLEIRSLKANHELELKAKEFELKHFKDDELKDLRGEIETLKKEAAVLRKENEMLHKITDLNADVIDVKKLVESLIGKLPEVKISSLAVHGGSDK